MAKEKQEIAGYLGRHECSWVSVSSTASVAVALEWARGSGYLG